MMRYIFLICAFIFYTDLHAKKIIFLGDSISEGYGIPQESAFPSLIETELKKTNPKISVVNSSIIGSTSASAVSRLKWILKSKPDVLFLSLGGNDGLRGLKLKSTQKNLQQAINLALKNNVKVILAGVRIPLNYGKKYRKQFKKMYSDLSQIKGVIYIPFILKDVAGIKSLNLPDGIHPNEKGHKIIFKNILPTIRKAL